VRSVAFRVQLVRVTVFVCAVTAATSLISACDYFGSESSPPPGSMILLTGFRHATDNCLDTPCGRIWKFGGPEVLYDVRGGHDVKALSEILSVNTVMVGDDEMTVVRRAGNKLAIRFQGATFEATNVRAEQDINDIVRMVGTYSSPDWKEVKRLLREAQPKK
jgi:hypothetical protein